MTSYFGRCDDDLSLGDLLLGHLRISRKFSDLGTENLQSRGKIADPVPKAIGYNLL